MIHPQAKVRPSATIDPTAIIGPNVTIGERVYVGPYAVIGMHAEHRDTHPRKDAPGDVVIGDDVIIHELVTVQGGHFGITRIHQHARIQAHAHVGHDATVGAYATVSCGAKVGGESWVGEWANLGLNAVLHQRSTMGEGTFLGASSFGKGTLQEWTVYAGVPARRLKDNEVGRRRKAEREQEDRDRATIV
jgi:UDP-N-acetylglucosamine acyltransferase